MNETSILNLGLESSFEMNETSNLNLGLESSFKIK